MCRWGKWIPHGWRRQMPWLSCICVASTAFFFLGVCLQSTWEEGSSPAGGHLKLYFAELAHCWYRDCAVIGDRLKAGVSHLLASHHPQAEDRFQTEKPGGPAEAAQTSKHLLKQGLVSTSETRGTGDLFLNGLNTSKQFLNIFRLLQWKKNVKPRTSVAYILNIYYLWITIRSPVFGKDKTSLRFTLQMFL